jgi:hypothetical protein
VARACLEALDEGLFLGEHRLLAIELGLLLDLRDRALLLVEIVVAGVALHLAAIELDDREHRDESARCDELRALGSQAVWGMKVGDRCFDLDDTTYVNACHAFEAGNGPETVTFYKSDSCSGGLAAFVGPWTDCADLSRYVRSAVWAIQIDGQCQDISDSNFVSACERFKPSR